MATPLPCTSDLAAGSWISMQCVGRNLDLPCTMAQLATILKKEIDMCTLNGDTIEKLLYQRRLANACPTSTHSPPPPAYSAAARACIGSPEAMIAAMQLLLEQTAAQFNISMPGSSSLVPAPPLTKQSDTTEATSSLFSERVLDPESDKSDVSQHHHLTALRWHSRDWARTGAPSCGVNIWPRGRQAGRLGGPGGISEGALGESGRNGRGREGGTGPFRNRNASSQSATMPRPRPIVLDEATLSKFYHLRLHEAAVQVSRIIVPLSLPDV